MARPHPNRPLKEKLKDLFAMHRGERRAFTVLLGLCIIAAAWVTWEQWIRPPMLADKEQIEVVWASMQDTLAERHTQQRAPREGIQRFAFDPNELPTEQWVMLGLSEKQADAIHRYEAHGGKFRTKRDLARMRVIDPDLFAQWEPYIQLPDSLVRQQRERFTREPWPKDTARWERKVPGEMAGRAQQVELNTADSATLVAVNGIGPAFARSILRYRDRLGGFTTIEQLREVPILRDKPDAVEKLMAKLLVDPSMARQLKLNTCSVEDLAKHPYMNWKVAKALIAYRAQHGPFLRVEDISQCVLVTDSIRERIAPYLTVGE